MSARRARSCLPFALLLLLLLAPPPPALAGWGSEPVHVHSTGNQCPQIVVCDDGEFGAIVAWEERETYDGGPLRVAHLLASGDLDPTWLPARIVSGAIGMRTGLRAFPDAAGGAVLTWTEGNSLRMLRVLADGTPSPDMPGEGRLVATMPSSDARPAVAADGGGGLYVSWVQGNPSALRVLRLGPDGLPRPGWSATGRLFFQLQDDQGNAGFVSSGSVVAAPGDGAFVVLAYFVVDPEWRVQPGAVRLHRIGPTGSGVPGWGAIRIAGFPADTMPCAAPVSAQWVASSMRLVDAAPDGAGGVYVLRGEAFDGALPGLSGLLTFALRLHHLDASQETAPGWPAEGRDVGITLPAPFGDLGVEASFRVWATGAGEVTFGTGNCVGTGGPFYETHRVCADGRLVAVGGDYIPGIEFSQSPAGVLYTTTFYPDGPRGPCDGVGHVSCFGSNGSGFFDMRPDSSSAFYYDVGVAALPDDGAIFAWGQYVSGPFGVRKGIYAVRLNAAGLVTDVPAAAPASRLAVRFVPGAGVRASVALAGAGEARLLLADVSGRAVARETFQAATGARHWTLAGTAALPPGLYFARLERGAEAFTARVVVTR